MAGPARRAHPGQEADAPAHQPRAIPVRADASRNTSSQCHARPCRATRLALSGTVHLERRRQVIQSGKFRTHPSHLILFGNYMTDW